VALSLLVGASAIIGNAIRIREGVQSEPPHLWGMLIGPPSSGKTPSMLAMLEVCALLEADAVPEWEDRWRVYEQEKETAKLIDDDWKSRAKEAVKGNLPVPERPIDADAPTPPQQLRVSVRDASIEELQNILSRQPRGVMLVRDELAGLVGSFDKYGGAGTDRAFLLEGYNGHEYTVDRVKFEGKPLRIPRNSIAILGGMQPDKFRELGQAPDDGFTARFLYVYPDQPPPRERTRETRSADAHYALLRSAARRLGAL
jgi:hypothetical protein